mgnify:CR=1 FL=1|tara:strand:+ start:5838 stop:6398 length:561 start_codon:yes stop_codon:yes gene_type:complete
MNNLSQNTWLNDAVNRKPSNGFPNVISIPEIHGAPDKVIKENSISGISFNVMPGMPVKETLLIKEYRIWHRYIEAQFDRKYFSSMEKSPDHLIFLTALVHLQKILYVYACHEFGFSYKKEDKERIKIWPTAVKVEMPKMITKQRDVVHRVLIKDIVKRNESSYYMFADSLIEGRLAIAGEASVFLI